MMFANCVHCGDEFSDYPSGFKNGRKYCSKSCANRVNTKKRHSREEFGFLKGTHPIREFGKGHIPWNLGKHIKLNNALAEWRKAGGQPWNKVGLTKKTKLLRVKFKRSIHPLVLKRDDYSCQMCGIRSAKGVPTALQVDHIKPWEEHPEERFNIDNCRTLCSACHYFITFGKVMMEKSIAWGHSSNIAGGNIL